MEKIFENCVRNSWYAVGMSADFPAEKLTGHVVCERRNGHMAHPGRGGCGL